MIQTQRLCDKCKFREAKEYIFYRTRETDQAGDDDYTDHSLDICDTCCRLLAMTFQRFVLAGSEEQVLREFKTDKWEKFFKWDVEEGEAK